MNTTPTRRLAALAAALSLALTGVAVTATTTSARADSPTATEAIDSGTITWGVRTSWRNYAGPGDLSDGLTANPAGEFVWQVESGTFDSETRHLELQTSGSVHWDLHEGSLDVTLSDLRLVVDGDEPQVFADVQSKRFDTGEMVDYGVVALVDLDLTTGEIATTDGVTTLSPTDSALTEVGVQVFAGFYGRGAVFDDVSASYDGPGGMPELPTDDFTAPASLGYTPGATTTDVLANAVDVLPDVDRNIVHVINETSIRAYDATTLAPLGAATSPSFSNGWTSYPAPVLHQGTGAIIGNLGGNVVAQQWDATAGAYVSTILQTGTAAGFTYNTVRDRVYLVTTAGISYVRYLNGVWSKVDYAWAAGNAPSMSRPGIAMDSGGRIVLVDADKKPQLITLAATIARVDLPGDYSNPVAQQPMYNQPTEVHAVASGGFKLTNYAGQIFTVTNPAIGVYARADGVQDLGLSQVLRSSYDAAADLWYLADWGAAKIVAVRGSNVAELTVKALGYSVLHTMPVAGDAGRLYAVAARAGENTDDFGLRTWTQEGVSPAVTTQPTVSTVDLTSWDGTVQRTLTAAGTGTPGPSVRWQTRAPGVTSQAGWTDVAGATTNELTVTLAEPDDGRQYRAIYTNPVGSLATTVVTTVVNVPPAILVEPADADVTEAADATFEVMPKGHPYPDVVWQRRVGGFWESIDPDDDNFAVDGGTLVARDTNTEQSGSLFRARLRNHVATVFTRAVRLDVAAASDVPRTIDAGALAWGVKESFRTYVEGPIASGTITVADGASRADDGTFRFPVESGTYTPNGDSVEVDYDGSVHFSGHAGLLELDVSDLRLTVAGDTGTLVADLVSRSLETGATEVFDDVEVATLDTAGAVSAGATTLSVAGVGATLTEAAAPAFGGFYTAGTALDDLGGSHELGDEISAPVPATVTVAPARTTTPYGRGAAVVVEVVRGEVPATGVVTVEVGSTAIEADLVDGRATVTLPPSLGPGSRPVRATYDGVVATTRVTVTKADAAVRIGLPVKKVSAGTAARVRVRVLIRGAAAGSWSGRWAVGRIVVREGSRVLAVGTLSATDTGVEVLRLPRLAPGRHYLEVTYAGSSAVAPGSAGPARLTVR